MNSNVIPFPDGRHIAGPAAAQRSTIDISDRLARLFELIAEVEQLAETHSGWQPGSHHNLPDLARKSRALLGHLAQGPVQFSPGEEVDPQPEIDRSLLERLYGVLPLDAQGA